MNNIQFPHTPFDLNKSLIILGKRGSEAHDLYINPSEDMGTDDRDVMGIVVQSLHNYLSPFQKWEGTDGINGYWDVVLYDIKKFINLLTKQNPNVLSLLWLEKEDYYFLSSGGKLLIEHRDIFKNHTYAYNSFTGYAYSQLKALNKNEYKGFMGKKRKEIVDKFGYDCKNASHLIRLLTMGIEYLETGELKIKRTDDRKFLLNIKQGKYSLNEIKNMADMLFKKAESYKEKSCLPDKINLEKIEKLTIEIILSKNHKNE